MSERFNVLLTGQLLGDKTLAEVMTNLAALFKVSKERASALLTHAPVVIKGSVDSTTGKKYVALVERAGARCRIEPVHQLQLGFDALPTPSLSPANSTATVPTHAPAAPLAPIPDSLTPTATPGPDLQTSAIKPTREGSFPPFLSDDESIQFEGSVVRQSDKSFPNFFKDGKGRVPSDFSCFITEKRLLLFSGDELFLDLPGSDIQRITKARPGTTIWHGANETTLTFTDEVRGDAALTGLIDPFRKQLPKPPAREELRPPSVSGGWAIALAPLIGGSIDATLIRFFGFRIILLWYALSAVFALIDSIRMRREGHAARTIIPKHPYIVPWYLFARAKAFGHGKSYAIIGGVIFAAALALEIMRFYARLTRVC